MWGTISRTLKGKHSYQLKFYKVMAVPVLMYGSENWSLNRSAKRKIEAAEMRFLRPMAGYTLWDKKTSSDIRKRLGIFNINDKLTQYKINWREHIQRMDDNRLPKTNGIRREKNYRKTPNEIKNNFREEGTGLSLLVDDDYAIYTCVCVRTYVCV